MAFSIFRNMMHPRVAAQIVSGIGFLGAGVIFMKHGTVSGLTTAAGMWATSGVGMCIGAGLYDIGILTTILMIAFQTLFHRSTFLRIDQSLCAVLLEVASENGNLQDIQHTIHAYGIDIQTMNINHADGDSILLHVEMKVPKTFCREDFLVLMSQKSYLKQLKYL